MIHLLKVLVKKIAKQSNITVIPCLLIYFSLDRLLLYLIFLNFARDKQNVLGTISIINVMKPTNLLLFPIIILCSFTSVKEIPPYKNPALPVDERVKDLLGRMTIEEKFWQTYMMPGDLDKGNEDQSIEQAVQAARESEIAIVVVGIEEGEFRDRGYLALPGRQEELIRKVAATGKTTVVVLIGGSAVVMSEWLDQVPAVLNAWYPGVEGGNAVADVLFGDYNPSGKLPITYPIHEAQLPLNYSHKPTGQSDDYLNLTGEPLFPFGHGLSYSEFDYSGLKVTKAVHGTAFHVTFYLKNTGKYAANEVVQLYSRDLVASVTQPIIRLIHFRPVSLAPRETKELHLTVNEKDLSMLDKELNRVIELGDFRLMIGRSCKDIRLKTTLTINHPMTLETNH